VHSPSKVKSLIDREDVVVEDVASVEEASQGDLELLIGQVAELELYVLLAVNIRLLSPR